MALASPNRRHAIIWTNLWWYSLQTHTHTAYASLDLDDWMSDLMSRDRLIFNMGLPIPGKDGLYIRTGPCVSISVRGFQYHTYASNAEVVHSTVSYWPFEVCSRDAECWLVARTTAKNMTLHIPWISVSTYTASPFLLELRFRKLWTNRHSGLSELLTHWWWFGAERRQSITRTHVGHGHWPHMTS